MRLLQIFLLGMLCGPLLLRAQTSHSVSKSKHSNVSGAKAKYDAYLFVYFTGNRKSEEAIRFALSKDGYNYKALNNNNPIVS